MVARSDQHKQISDKKFLVKLQTRARIIGSLHQQRFESVLREKLSVWRLWRFPAEEFGKHCSNPFLLIVPNRLDIPLRALFWLSLPRVVKRLTQLGREQT